MLKHRLITAAILIPIVLWGMFSFTTYPSFALAIGVFIFLGLLEWTRLIHLQETKSRFSYIAMVLLLCITSLFIMESPVFFTLFLIASVIWWLVEIGELSAFDSLDSSIEKSLLSNLWTGVFLLVPTFASFCFLHQSPDNGPQLVLTLLILVWSADTAAYFAGRKYGKNKLAPLISPGKTKEGAYGALIAVAIVAFFAAILLGLSFWKILLFVILSQVITIFSIGGDLLESVYKRRAGVKDSGQLLPGHGGMLDRIDSVMAAAPLFTLVVWSLGLIP